MADITNISFQLCLILFSVLLGWAIYNLLDQYPCLHRFGHIWAKEEVAGLRNARILLICWLSLIVIIICSAYSLSKTYELFKKFNIDYTPGFFVYCTLGLFNFIYLFLPYLINRFIWGLAIFTTHSDFEAYAKDTERKKRWLEKRYSESTIQILKKRPVLCGGIITINTALLLAFLILSPNYLLWFWHWFKTCPCNAFAVLGAVVVITLVFYIPYTRWVKLNEPRKQ